MRRQKDYRNQGEWRTPEDCDPPKQLSRAHIDSQRLEVNVRTTPGPLHNLMAVSSWCFCVMVHVYLAHACLHLELLLSFCISLSIQDGRVFVFFVYYFCFVWLCLLESCSFLKRKQKRSESQGEET